MLKKSFRGNRVQSIQNQWSLRRSSWTGQMAVNHCYFACVPYRFPFFSTSCLLISFLSLFATTAGFVRSMYSTCPFVVRTDDTALKLTSVKRGMLMYLDKHLSGYITTFIFILDQVSGISASRSILHIFWMVDWLQYTDGYGST